MQAKELSIIYEKLRCCYGPQHWWPGDTPFEVCIGAILTQNTAWQNVEKAIQNLKAAGKLDAPSLRAIPEAELANLIRPSGYYNTKAKKLKAFVTWLEQRCHDDLANLFQTETASLRQELLDIYGIGEETADSILLYAGYKPVFVVDAYTKRIFSRLRLIPPAKPYAEIQAIFMNNLPEDTPLFNEYHALIVRHGKETCRRQPRCRGCCLARSDALNNTQNPYPCSLV